MAWTARGSCTVAMTRSRPPQGGQVRTSKSNTRRIRAAQVHAPGVSAARGLASTGRARWTQGSGGRSGQPVSAVEHAGRGCRDTRAVHRGPRDDGRELLQEFDGLEEEVRRAIAPHGLELDEDASIGAEAEAVLGERGQVFRVMM